MLLVVALLPWTALASAVARMLPAENCQTHCARAGKSAHACCKKPAPDKPQLLSTKRCGCCPAVPATGTGITAAISENSDSTIVLTRQAVQRLHAETIQAHRIAWTLLFQRPPPIFS
ncbi:MAG: hypothetical protein K2Q23_15900 [Bryobacteraceae bacterium]|nr:hypothetical protein [Bryobacteraceae bacterium]